MAGVPFRCSFLVFLFFAIAGFPCGGSELSYVGPEKCAVCHSAIAESQNQTAMANTWQGALSAWLPKQFNAVAPDDPSYVISKSGDLLDYSIDLPNGNRINAPVAIMVGGKRHGLGFLVPFSEVDGIPLARPALIQARYAWSPEKQKLLLAPGCAALKPTSTEAALGLALSPTFESRCLTCHGQPNQHGSGSTGGVHCESCHGAGSGHLQSVGHAKANLEIINPKRLSNEDSINLCAQCHVGLTRFSDPSSDDLLVANQVHAIKSSECWRQSGKAFSCTTCHDPHQDALANDDKAVKACLGCHSKDIASHAAICPVNRQDKCITCHMPSVEMGPLHLVDHLIRVHPEQVNSGHASALRSEVRPLSEYLRMITSRTPEVADAAYNRVAQGESFYDVAKAVSTHKTATIGGYLGLKTLAELETPLSVAAASLGYGEISKPFQAGSEWIVLQRLPRDFRWNAEQRQKAAEELAAAGRLIDAVQQSQRALMIDPQYLRALRFIGDAFTQNGNPAKGAEVLRTALRLYPNDASTKFDLAKSLELLGNQAAAIEEYRQVVALEPDFVAAYLSLGRLYQSAGDGPQAIKTFRAGLQIDPLSADLYGNLAMALTQSGDNSETEQAKNLAIKLGVPRR